MSDDYKNCIINFNETGNAKITLSGKGKFENIAIFNGTKEYAEISAPLPEYGDAVEFIEALYADEHFKENYSLEEDDTNDKNIRFVGSTPNNYVSFNNELWRIIGIFDVANEMGGSEYPRVKLVRVGSIGSYSWDSSSSSENDKNGINQWGESTYEDGTAYNGADIMQILNNEYLNQGTGYCCTAVGKDSCTASTGVVCDFTTNTQKVRGLDATARSLIGDAVWKTGALVYASTTPVKKAYEDERGTATGKDCELIAKACDDKVERKIEWKGKIGLIYPSDYGYASTDDVCRSNIRDKTKYACSLNNWLYNSTTDWWTFTPRSIDSASYYGWYVRNDGYFGGIATGYANGIIPSVYLNTDVKIVDGLGTYDAPFKLSL